ncbi:MAG: LTA synthase family protein [Pseudomonadota bacterium]
MIDTIPAYFLSLIGALLADAWTRPHAPSARLGLRALVGIWVTALIAAAGFGVFLAVSGNPLLASILMIAVLGILALASNAKRGVLGEPLLFSDLALLGAMLKHPQFYFSVLALWQQVVGVIGLVALVAVLAWLFKPDAAMALIGAGISGVALIVLAICVRLPPLAGLAQSPQADADVQRLGLATTLLLYWLRWRSARTALRLQEPVPIKQAAGADPSEIIIVVQCESFADPTEIFASGGADLPNLARAKRESVQFGRLNVSGFGAYTMRTEYGVLFGREEAELGFLLYDPYLTALHDPAPALPQKLAPSGWRSVFVHPHDMRFYSRDKILPKAGFADLIGEETFAKPASGAGRYVRDTDVATKLLSLAAKATSPTLLYAVTMENHGPWAPHGDASASSMVENYNSLVLAGDAMLGQLLDGMAELEKPATLVFFGDHRPTIPGASDPGGDKHTPYVIVQPGRGDSEARKASERVDLTPAQLHQAILDWGAN